jgi:hypothetical protein
MPDRKSDRCAEAKAPLLCFRDLWAEPDDAYVPVFWPAIKRAYKPQTMGASKNVDHDFDSASLPVYAFGAHGAGEGVSPLQTPFHDSETTCLPSDL